MIRKPREEDFRESEAVLAVRDSARAAADGVKTTTRVARKAYSYYLAATMGFGFLVSLAPYLLSETASLVALLGMAGHVWHRRCAFSTGETNYTARVRRRVQTNDSLPDGVVRSDTGRNGKLDAAAFMTAAGVLFVLAAIIFLTRAINPLRIASVLAAMVMISAGLLIGARLFRGRKVVEWDDREITVTGLTRCASLLWRDVGSIRLHSFSPFDVGVLLTSGSRHNLVISARNRRAGGPKWLLVPVGMLALDEAGIDDLAKQLLRCQEDSGWSDRPVAGYADRMDRRHLLGGEVQPARRSFGLRGTDHEPGVGSESRSN